MPRTGMTVKQFAVQHFFETLRLYQESKKHLKSAKGRKAFIMLSLKMHAAKAHVPKQ